MYRGNLLEVSPSSPKSELVAKTMMTLYESDLLLAGIQSGDLFPKTLH
jgi:hypothetical protein